MMSYLIKIYTIRKFSYFFSLVLKGLKERWLEAPIGEFLSFIWEDFLLKGSKQAESSLPL